MPDAIMQKGLSSVELHIATQADLLRHLSPAAQQRGESVVGLYANSDNTNAINAYFASGFVMRQHHSV